MSETTKKNIKKDKADKSTLEKLKIKKDQLNARIQILENKEKESVRKKENRVKFLIGSFMLDNFLKEKEKHVELFKNFNAYLTRERDQEIVKSYFEKK